MVVVGESKFPDLKICSRVGVSFARVSPASSAISSSRGGAGGSSATDTSFAGSILLATMFPILLPATFAAALPSAKSAALGLCHT